MSREPFFKTKGNVNVKECNFSDNITDIVVQFKSHKSTDIIILGLSILRRRDGQMVALAISSPDNALILNSGIGRNLSQKRTRPIHSSVNLLFSDPRIRFAGFYFHRLAIQLKACLAIDLQGFDIVHNYNGNESYTSPGEVVSQKLSSKDFRFFEINRLWDEVIDRPSRKNSLNNLVDRAWVTGK